MTKPDTEAVSALALTVVAAPGAEAGIRALRLGGSAVDAVLTAAPGTLADVPTVTETQEHPCRPIAGGLLMVRSNLLFATLLSLLAIPLEAQEPTLIVENGRVIIGDGTVIERGTVVIAGERIVLVSDEPVEGTGARRIDAAGRTVLPGLIDTHVHMLVEDLEAQPRSESELQSFLQEGLPARLNAFLQAGITTVMSTGDFWPYIRDVRDAIESGNLVGPRVFTSGPVLTAPGGHPAGGPVCGPWAGREANPWCTEHMAAVARTPSEARTAIGRLASEGVDYVKMVFGDTDPPEVELLDPDLAREVVLAAHSNGLRVYAHINEVPKALSAVGWGLDGLVHTPIANSVSGGEEQLAAAVGSRDVSISTTIVAVDELQRQMSGAGNEQMAQWFSDNRRASQRMVAQVAQAGDHLIALVTDTPQLSPGEAYLREVWLVSEAGLTPHQVVRAATRNAAAHMGREEDLGTLAEGKLADLIIVDGNPLEDLSALGKVRVVVKGGKVRVEH